MRHDFGYPFAEHEVLDPDNCQVVDASCEGECEEQGALTTGHSHCQPDWRRDIVANGGTVIDGPVLEHDGWVALVEYTTFKRRYFECVSNLKTRGEYGVVVLGGSNIPDDPEGIYTFDPDVLGTFRIAAIGDPDFVEVTEEEYAAL